MAGLILIRAYELWNHTQRQERNWENILPSNTIKINYFRNRLHMQPVFLSSLFMNKNRTWLFYFCMLIVFGSIIYFIIQQGSGLQTTAANSVTTNSSSLEQFKEHFNFNLSLSLPVLLLQIIVIVVAVRFFGWLFNKIGQP